MKRNKRGISLIVLVITIIVMIVLAAAIILTLNNTGIIGRANEAIDKTNAAQVQQLASVKWAEGYASGLRKQEDLEKYVTDELVKEEIDTDKYKIIVTEKGVDALAKDSIWIQEGLKVKKGNQVLNIGDTIAYDETNGSTITDLTETEWQVLGANDKGELLILSTADVDQLVLGSADDLEEAKNDYITGIEQLDEVCNPYGKGKGAIDARSINREDVDKITGYVPTTGTDMLAYGAETTYSWIGTGSVLYEIKGGDSGPAPFSGTDTFIWYNAEKNKFETSIVSTAAAEDNPEKIATMTMTQSGYSPDHVMDKDNSAYKMLFGRGYWLASHAISGMGPAYMWDNVGSIVAMQLDTVGGGSMILNASGASNEVQNNVRAVVTLSLNIEVTGSSEDGWTF